MEEIGLALVPLEALNYSRLMLNLVFLHHRNHILETGLELEHSLIHSFGQTPVHAVAVFHAVIITLATLI
jgi:hypothetical protein